VVARAIATSYSARMTPAQRTYLIAVDTLHKRLGFSPTLREVANERGVSSTNAVNDVLSRLERDGLLVRNGHKARTMRLTDAGRMALQEQG